jgi:hypothetical protein
MRRTELLSAVAIAALLTITACGPSQESAGQGGNPSPAASSKPPFGFLNSPTENQTVAPGTFVSGWALDDSGIAEVTVVFDDGQKGYVRLGDDFPGVKAKYPNYPDSDKAGYVFAIPKMTPGPHSLTVTVRAKDGGTQVINRTFSIP